MGWESASEPGEHDSRAHQFRVRLTGGPLDGSERYCIADQHHSDLPRLFVILPVGDDAECWQRGELDGDGVWVYHHCPDL